MKRYLIIGNGVAGARAADKIRETDPTGEILIFTEEAYPFYSRIRFPELIAGEVTLKDITIYPNEWYQERSISLHLEETVQEVDCEKKQVLSLKGKGYPYDSLLMATGGIAFIPPIKGVERKGVFVLRVARDALEFKEFMTGVKRAILIGGGLVGLEAGGALLKQGIQVSVIEFSPRLLPRQMDSEGAAILQQKMEAMGFSFFLNAQSEEILGQEKVEGVRLKDGRTIEGRMVLVSAGVRSNVKLAKAMGLQVNQGIVVNDRMETNKEYVFAAGDASEHRGRCYGIWPAAQRQGEIAGVNMAGGNIPYEGTVVSNTLKVVGISLISTGEIDADGKLGCMVRSDPVNGTYCKVIFKEEKTIGCILLGDVNESSKIKNAVAKGTSMNEVRELLADEKFDSRPAGGK